MSNAMKPGPDALLSLDRGITELRDALDRMVAERRAAPTRLQRLERVAATAQAFASDFSDGTLIYEDEQGDQSCLSCSSPIGRCWEGCRWQALSDALAALAAEKEVA